MTGGDTDCVRLILAMQITRNNIFKQVFFSFCIYFFYVFTLLKTFYYLLQQLSMAIQRGTSASVMGSIGNYHSLIFIIFSLFSFFPVHF